MKVNGRRIAAAVDNRASEKKEIRTRRRVAIPAVERIVFDEVLAEYGRRRTRRTSPKPLEG